MVDRSSLRTGTLRHYWIILTLFWLLSSSLGFSLDRRQPKTTDKVVKVPAVVKVFKPKEGSGIGTSGILVGGGSTPSTATTGGVKLLTTLPPTLMLYIGGESKTVKLFTLDTAKGTLTLKKSSDVLGPSAIWLAFDKSHKIIVSASASNFEGREKSGGVFSASVGADGSLTKVSASLAPEAPVSIEFSPDGKTIAVASYNGASLTTYGIGADGKLTQALQPFEFKGSGPNKERQATAAAHQAKVDPSGQVLLVPDLGSDRIHSFSYSTSGLTQNTDIVVKAGCGPRHVEHPPEQGKPGDPIKFYVLCELSSDIILLELAAPNAQTATVKQTISSLQKGADAKTFNAAEILITPDGKFLYTTNRQKDKAGKVEDNTFGVFARDATTGELKSAGTFPTGGKQPRHFAFSPDKAASLVVVTNQESNQLTVHKRDPTTGALTQLSSTDVEAPAMALFKF